METNNRVDTWRSAMKDEAHPRYRAAWFLFSPQDNTKAAARLLQDQSLDIIPWLYEILDTPELYLESTLGKGKAPVHAVALLGYWQVTEAIPRLLSIIEQETWENDVFDETISALQRMGPEALDPVLAFAEDIPGDKPVDLTAIVCRIGGDDERAFRYIQQVFEREHDDVLQMFVAGNLFELAPEPARAYFQTYLRHNKVGPQTKAFIENPTPRPR